MPPDLPPVRNRPLYIWRVFGKAFSFFLFGLGSLILISAALPLMRLLVRPRGRFQRRGHSLISRLFYVFTRIMAALGVFKLEIARQDRERLRTLRSKVIVANHPSLLDVVVLIALIPNADCVVNSGLLKGITGGVIRNLYIPNSLAHTELIARCTRSLAAGNCLIIFPEGTRTPRGGKAPLKKGAARIAVNARRPVLPVRIGGTDKYGLGKRDPFLSYNPTEKYIYKLSILPELAPPGNPALLPSVAITRLHAAIARALFG